VTNSSAATVNATEIEFIFLLAISKYISGLFKPTSE
jgi:hypothetical protein